MTETNGEVRYKLTEVCRLADVQPYVLRYWESEFTSLAPDRTIPGPRTYSAKDLKVVERIKKLLYDEGYTIAGAKKRLESELKPEPKPDLPPESAPAAAVTAVLAMQPPLPPKPRSRKAAAQAQPALADLILDEVVAHEAVPPAPPAPEPPAEPKPEPVRSADSAAPMVLHVADPRVATALAELRQIRDLLSSPV